MAVVSQTPVDWQSSKTFLERNHHMLEHEIGTDVIFLVGSENPVKIKAHKYMLMSRSAVFETMFTGEMAKHEIRPDQGIRVTDIEVDCFRELLCFIYEETVNIKGENVFSLLYAAKKYMLQDLVEKTQKCLQENVDVDNVCCILDQSLIFDQKQLTQNCLKYISKNTVAVMKSRENELVKVSKEALLLVVSLDEVNVSETGMYEMCIQWAKTELTADNKRAIITDKTIRATLGEILYKIRFPTMTNEEFANLIEDSSVLTEIEKLSIFYYISTNKANKDLKFDTRKRKKPLLDRFNTVNKQRQQTAGQDAICFCTDKNVKLTGIGLYEGEMVYTVEVELWSRQTKLFSMTASISRDGKSAPKRIFFTEPVSIKSGQIHSIVIRYPRDILLSFSGIYEKAVNQVTDIRKREEPSFGEAVQIYEAEFLYNDVVDANEVYDIGIFSILQTYNSQINICKTENGPTFFLFSPSLCITIQQNYGYYANLTYCPTPPPSITDGARGYNSSNYYYGGGNRWGSNSLPQSQSKLYSGTSDVFQGQIPQLFYECGAD